MCRVLLLPFWSRATLRRTFKEELESSLLLFDGLSRCSQLVPLGSGRFRRVERGSGTAAASSDHLESTPAEIQVRTCQACDAGSRSRNGGGQWGSSLDIVGKQFLVTLMCRVCRLRASLRGATSASVHPARKTHVDSFRRVRCIVCSAAAASVGSCFVSCL